MLFLGGEPCVFQRLFRLSEAVLKFGPGLRERGDLLGSRAPFFDQCFDGFRQAALEFLFRAGNGGEAFGGDVMGLGERVLGLGQPPFDLGLRGGQRSVLLLCGAYRFVEGLGGLGETALKIIPRCGESAMLLVRGVTCLSEGILDLVQPPFEFCLLGCKGLVLPLGGKLRFGKRVFGVAQSLLDFVFRG